MNDKLVFIGDVSGITVFDLNIQSDESSMADALPSIPTRRKRKRKDRGGPRISQTVGNSLAASDPLDPFNDQ